MPRKRQIISSEIYDKVKRKLEANPTDIDAILKSSGVKFYSKKLHVEYFIITDDNAHLTISQTITDNGRPLSSISIKSKKGIIQEDMMFG